MSYEGLGPCLRRDDGVFIDSATKYGECLPAPANNHKGCAGRDNLGSRLRGQVNMGPRLRGQVNLGPRLRGQVNLGPRLGGDGVR